MRRQHGLSAAAAALCRRLAARATEQGLHGKALQWLLCARDEAGAAQLVAPLVAEVGEHLAARRGGSYSPSALQLPQLQELEPLLSCLPGGGDAGALAAALSFPELQFLASFQQLDAALAALQQQQAAVASAAAGAAVTPGSKAARALEEAYAAARGPALALLRPGGLAPPALVPALLAHVVPLLESEWLAFSEADVKLLLARHMEAERAEAAGLVGGGASDGGRGAARGAMDVRLALTRALARAHIAGTTMAA